MFLERIYPKKQVIGVSIEEPAPPEIVGRGIQDSTLYRVKVTMNGVKLPLLKKDFDSSSLQVGYVQKIFDRHASLKKLGLPTIPLMFRDINDTKSLYVTDLTADGERVCMSSMDWQSNGNRHGLRCGDFSLVDLKNPHEVAVQFADLLERMTRLGVRCWHGDVFFLVVDIESGTGRILLGDLGQVELKTSSSTLFRENLRQNYFVMSPFLREINKHLSAPISSDPLWKCLEGHTQKV